MSPRVDNQGSRGDGTRMTDDVLARPANRRGRPPGPSARELELAPVRLFTEQGFHETTVDQIAAAAGVSRRTFFRYYDAKADVLWNEFDTEVETIRSLLAGSPPDLPVFAAAARRAPPRPAGVRRGPPRGARGQPLPRGRRAGAAPPDDAAEHGAGPGRER